MMILLAELKAMTSRNKTNNNNTKNNNNNNNNNTYNNNKIVTRVIPKYQNFSKQLTTRLHVIARCNYKN